MSCRQPADAAQQRGQVFAVDVLHGDEDLAVGLADVVDAADVGVRDLAGDADFFAKASQPGRVRCPTAGEELERHDLPERQVIRPVDLAHAAAAEQAGDAIAAGHLRAGDQVLVQADHGHGFAG